MVELTGWAVILQGMITVTINAIVNYLVVKHLIQGVYEQKLKKLWKKRKR